MQFRAEAIFDSCRANLFGFLSGEKTCLAKNINVISKFFGGNYRKHFSDNEVNITLVIVFVL
jgi:hypothetical protein